MEAAGDKSYFVTRWLGRGNRLLDVKVTAPDLDVARRLSDKVVRSVAPQVFK